MTKISEAFTTQRHGPSTPHGPRANLRKEGWGWFWTAWTGRAWPASPAIARVLGACVPV